MLGELIVKISADTSDFQDKMKSTTSKLGEFGSKMKQIGGGLTLALTLPLVLLGAQSLKLASNMEETLNKVDVTFGKNSKAVKAWAKNSIKQMGLAQQSALDNVALFGDFATSMGITGTEAVSMSESLTQLGADLSSFKNVPIEQAMGALKGVFTGETEAMKGLGVVMTDTNLEAFALSTGFMKNKVDADKLAEANFNLEQAQKKLTNALTKHGVGSAEAEKAQYAYNKALLASNEAQQGSYKDLTQAEKVQLRYNYVLANTTNAQGDFARTSDGMANQVRMLNENFKELGATIGKDILPFFTGLVKAMNKTVTAFGNLNPTFRKFLIVTLLIVAIIPPLLIGIGLVAQGIAVLTTVAIALGVTLGVLVLIIAGVILAIVAIGVAVYYIIKYWEPIKEFFINLWEGIKDIFTATFDWIKDLIVNSPIAKLFKIYFEAIEIIIKAFLIVFLSVWQAISDFLTPWLNMFGDWIVKTWEDIVGGIKFAIDKLQPVFDVFTRTYDGIVNQWTGLKKFFSELFDFIGYAMRDGLNIAIRFINKMIDKVQNNINKVIDALNVMGKGFGIKIDRVEFGRLEEVGMESRLGKQFNGVNAINPNNVNTNIFIDGKQVASSVAPYMTDSILASQGVSYR